MTKTGTLKDRDELQFARAIAYPYPSFDGSTRRRKVKWSPDFTSVEKLEAWIARLPGSHRRMVIIDVVVSRHAGDIAVGDMVPDVSQTLSSVELDSTGRFIKKGSGAYLNVWPYGPKDARQEVWITEKREDV
jgi:hypothetical protein